MTIRYSDLIDMHIDYRLRLEEAIYAENINLLNDDSYRMTYWLDEYECHDKTLREAVCKYISICNMVINCIKKFDYGLASTIIEGHCFDTLYLRVIQAKTELEEITLSFKNAA